MKLLALTLVLALLIAAACTPVLDTPALRATVEAKVTPTVLGKPPMLGGSIRVNIVPPPTPTATVEPSLMPTITPKVSAP